MTREEILAGESKNVEFKVSRPEKSIKYMKSVVAFTNGKGGRIVFGIDDETREIVGIPEENVFREMDAITNAISDSCEPVIVPDIYLQTIDNKNIIIVEISSGKQKPYYIKQDGITDGVYVRVSGTSRKADRSMTQELYYESEGRSYDTVIRRDVPISDEEIEKLCIEMKQVARSKCKDDMQREYEGPLWQQAEEAFQFVLRNIRLGARIEGLYRQDIYELPPDSIRELIINALMNCSFLKPSHIQVAIFDDRLEITSPGGLMPGVTIERMKEGYSQIRNRALAHAFSYMNLIEGWGTGIPRLLREMKEYGLAEPEFVDMEIALRINLYRAEITIQDNAKKVQENAGEVENSALEMHKFKEMRLKYAQNALKRELSAQEKMVLEIIVENGNITSAQLMERLNLKKRRAQVILGKMVEDKLIRKKGASRSTNYAFNEELLKS